MNPCSGLAHPSLRTWTHSLSTRLRRRRCGSSAASRRSAARRPPSSGATRSTSRPPSGSIRLARHRTPRRCATALASAVPAFTPTRTPTLALPTPTAATATRAGATARSRPGCAASCDNPARKAACVAMARWEGAAAAAAARFGSAGGAPRPPLPLPPHHLVVSSLYRGCVLFGFVKLAATTGPSQWLRG